MIMSYIRTLFMWETTGFVILLHQGPSALVYFHSLVLAAFTQCLHSVCLEFLNMNLGQSDCKGQGGEEVMEKVPDTRFAEGKLTSYHIPAQNYFNIFETS